MMDSSQDLVSQLPTKPGKTMQNPAEVHLGLITMNHSPPVHVMLCNTSEVLQQYFKGQFMPMMEDADKAWQSTNHNYSGMEIRTSIRSSEKSTTQAQAVSLDTSSIRAEDLESSAGGKQPYKRTSSKLDSGSGTFRQILTTSGRFCANHAWHIGSCRDTGSRWRPTTFSKYILRNMIGQ